jgi:two-component system response regulator HydG
MKGRILIVDDDQAMCDLLDVGLRKRDYAVTTTRSGLDALQLMAGGEFDVVVTDVNMGAMNGIDLCRQIVQNRPDIRVVVITAFGSLETAIDAIRVGAYDFITKPFELETLTLALDRAIEHRALREEVRRLRQVVAEASTPGTLLGQSPEMKRVRDLIRRVADSEASVLITGESGTGKELVARALHTESRRADGPFVAINCSALPETLLESELFGHVKGAFTDARSARTGLFLQAHGGSLFLDEIGDLPLGLQPKLLRALQERTVRPVGGGAEIPFDCRIICATNRDLEAAVEEKRFREDLFFRINVIHIPLPPLRVRSGDVLELAQRFVERLAGQAQKNVRGLTSAAAQRLLAYSWPGNVRELENCLQRAVTLTAYDQITVDDLPDRVRENRGAKSQPPLETQGDLVSLEEIERRYILRVVQAVSGNKSMAAQILGLDRRTLYRKLERYGAVALESEK